MLEEIVENISDHKKINHLVLKPDCLLEALKDTKAKYFGHIITRIIGEDPDVWKNQRQQKT